MPNQFTKLFLNFFLFLPLGLWAQLIIQVNDIPDNTPAEDNIYIAGDFNEWSTDNDDYRLEANTAGGYQLSLNLSAGSYEFKFTRGGWDSVEATAEGNYRPNRSVTYDGGMQTETVTIAGWEDLAGHNSTATGNVEVLSEDFYMPQLDRNRRIWVYLPPDYYTSNRSYPVLYMNDGQNLFDEASSFSGEWEVDESLNNLFAQGDNGIIVIGIENGGADRLAEYTPWENPQYGGGEGAAYVDFLVETLKPYVDGNFRTLSDQPNTGIMGSSLGGLISLYACIRHQNVFGRAGIMSPSLWFTHDIYDFVSSTGKQQNLKIALLAGEQESATMIPLLQDMYSTLLSAGFTTDELSLETHGDGEHSEWYWRREFPATYQWLFQTISVLDKSLELTGLRYWPNPTQGRVQFGTLPGAPGSWMATFYNSQGVPVQSVSELNQEVPIDNLPAGPYFIMLKSTTGQWALVHLIKS